jgi:hypothetical protein
MAQVLGFAGGCTRARQCCLALCLLSVMIALVPLADVRPPDPTWIDGFYDDWDFDEVVEILVSVSGVVGKIAADCTAAPDLIARAVSPESSVFGAATGSCLFTVRAPPFPARIATA